MKLGFFKKLIFMAIFLAILMLNSTNASALHVNETVNGFKVSFQARDDVNMIAKVWGGPEIFNGNSYPVNAPPENLSKVYMVLGGNLSQSSSKYVGCILLVFDDKINASRERLEDLLLKNNTKKYVRISDIRIDGHDGTLIRTSEEPSGPFEYLAAYWLDEANDMASKLVMVLSQWPWNDGTGALFETVHVKEVR